jgi:hypothetical protein
MPTWYTASTAKSDLGITVSEKQLAAAREQCLRVKGLSLWTPAPPTESFAQGVVYQALANKQASQVATTDELGGEINGVRVYPLDAKIMALLIIPAPAPGSFEPVTLTWPSGWTITLTRVGDVVTGVLTTTNTANGNQVLPVPPQFTAAGTQNQTSYDSATNPQLIVTFNEIGGNVGVSALAVAPPAAGTQLTIHWVADPIEDSSAGDTGRVGSLIG